jgi:hypothetical protein
MPDAKVQFKSHQDCIPSYANVALVNPLSDDIIIDFGFVDPLTLRDSRQDSQGEITVDSRPLARLIIGPALAKQLISELQEALDIANERREKNESQDT